MEWYFRDISDDPSEKELTQQDQFNNDEVALAEALVRETVQNSTDARLLPHVPVRVRFALVQPQSDEAVTFLAGLLDGLTPHLKACRLLLPGGSPRYLVVEDFNTIGLRGSIDTKDDGQFCGFWRRFGRSNKKDSSGGRWGLGKLVFSSSSAIRTLIGLTRRADTPQVCLMGQAILRNHSIDGKERDSVGFWCESGPRPGLPRTDPEGCKSIGDMLGLHRDKDSGLSLVVPYVLPDIQAQHLIAATLKHYYYPILTGGLVVDIDGRIIDAHSFDQTSAEFGADGMAGSILSFVRNLQTIRQFPPHAILPSSWQSAAVTADTLGPHMTKLLRERYKSGDMLYVRAPLSVQPKAGDAGETYVDLFLRTTTTGERAQSLVVRGLITVPTEGKKAVLPDCHAALIADHPLISQFLGDAENPAHTQWNERAEKLRQNWTRGHAVLRRVRAILHELHAVVAERIERDDPAALVDFFSIPKPREARGRRGPSTPPPIPPGLKVTPKPFRIERRAGGFSLIADPAMAADRLPLKIRLRCAYDVLNGNPFRRFSEEDFSFFRSDLRIEAWSLDYWPTDPNEIDIEARKADFRLEVFGFDANRDLVVEAQG